MVTERSRRVVAGGGVSDQLQRRSILISSACLLVPMNCVIATKIYRPAISFRDGGTFSDRPHPQFVRSPPLGEPRVGLLIQPRRLISFPLRQAAMSLLGANRTWLNWANPTRCGAIADVYQRCRCRTPITRRASRLCLNDPPHLNTWLGRFAIPPGSGVFRPPGEHSVR